MLNLIVQVIKNTFYIINWNCYCFITIALGISLFKNLKFYWDYVTDAINVLFTVKIKTWVTSSVEYINAKHLCRVVTIEIDFCYFLTRTHSNLYS